jgi:hypothetical protein
LKKRDRRGAGLKIASNLEIFGNKEAWEARLDGEGGVQLQSLGVGDLRRPACSTRIKMRIIAKL